MLTVRLQKGGEEKMDINAAIRTSAIIYSDELGANKTDSIERKFIESVFVLNDNKEMSVFEVIQYLETKFTLHFEETEIEDLVNKSNTHFEYNQVTNLLSLTKKRYEYLSSKKYCPENIVKRFLDRYPEYSQINILQLIEKYLYELLNTNIEAYLYIINPRKYAEKQGVVDPKKFLDEEIDVLNTIILWNDDEKNKLFFQLISFSIEYALVSNNSNNTVFYESLHNKVFYLDSNIVFRAVGINGDFRKQRTKYFLKKCIESGQKFSITRYTLQEINTSIDSHINELKQYSYGKISPDLFDICGSNEDFYQFYHKWRKDRSSKSLEVFKAFLLSEIENLFISYNVTKDYKATVDLRKKDTEKKFTHYKEELLEIKKYQNTVPIETDVINVLLIERKRNGNDYSIRDTKYYLLSTDQRLKQWDTYHSLNQPITILPSHWMGLLLKFISRTDDDFNSFTSFLKIQSNSPLLSPEELETVVTAISEMTEDFKIQNQIMRTLVESKFDNIIKQEITKKVLHDNVISYSKAMIEDIYSHEISIKESEIDELSKKHKNEINSLKIQFLTDRISDKKEMLEDAIAKKDELEDIKEKLLAKVAKKYVLRVVVTIVLALIYVIGALTLILIVDWNTLEPYTWWGSLTYGVISYLIMSIVGKSFNPADVYDREKIVLGLAKKNSFDENVLKDCISNVSDLEKEITKLESELKELQ